MILKYENYKKYLPVIMWFALVVLCLVRYAEPVKDGDVLWHIKYGEYHVQNKTTLIDHSIFSWTPAAKYAPYCTWAADVLLYLLFQAGGWPLLYIFMYGCIFFPVLTAGLFAKKVGIRGYGLTFFILIILQQAVADASYMKPEILSLVFFVLISALYFNLKVDRLNEKKGRLFLLFPLIFIAWANMHGVFFMGLALLAAIVTGELVNYLIKSKQAFPKRTILFLTISGLLSAAATLLTPYGTDLVRHLLNFANEGMAANIKNNILAYQSALNGIWINSVEHSLEFWGIMAILFVILFFVDAKKSRGLDFGILLPTIFLAMINLRYIRASFYWPPFSALSILYLAGRERVDLITLIKNAKPVIRNGLVMLLGVLSLFFSGRSLYDQIRWPTRWSYIGYGFNYSLPVQESAFLKDAHIGNKLFNTYNGGSYLLFHLYPERKVFIDNRYFPYKNSLFEKYFAFRDGRISLKEMESEFGFDTAVIGTQEMFFNRFLESDDWRAVFYGTSGVVMVNKDVKFDQDITKLDKHRFDGLKNLSQAAAIVRMAQNLSDFDTADYIIEIMQKRMRYDGLYSYLYPHCEISQKGLRAFNRGDYDSAFDYLRQAGFNYETVAVNKALKTVINYKVDQLMKKEKYGDALPLMARLVNYFRNDGDVMYNAGVIAYLASKQAENTGVAVNLPAWREALYRLLAMKPDHPYADIAKKLLADGDFPGKLPLVLDSFGGIK